MPSLPARCASPYQGRAVAVGLRRRGQNGAADLLPFHRCGLAGRCRCAYRDLHRLRPAAAGL
eukprot:12241409-Alexandrium_andersonii.AAC.1